MRGQGLSIRYIVVLVLAILVLVLVGLMLYRTQSSSNAINRENAVNTCRDLCVQAENVAIGAQGNANQFDWPSLGAPKYCNVVLNVDGEQKHCYELYTCTLIDGDGDQRTLDESTCNDQTLWS